MFASKLVSVTDVILHLKCVRVCVCLCIYVCVCVGVCLCGCKCPCMSVCIYVDLRLEISDVVILRPDVMI